MKNFFSYFFGQGETQEFYYFSFAHIIPIILLVAVICLIILYRKQIREYKHESRIRFALSLTMIITEMSYFWRLVGVESLNANPVDHLPITVCGWALIFSSYLLMNKSQTLFDITYFWILTGSIFGLLTPTVIIKCGPTRFRYYQFWLEHTLGFITLFYMMFVHNMRPNIKSIFKSYGFLIILGIIAIIANKMLPGANYLFLADTEDAATILDILPKNFALKTFIMAVLIGLLFFLAYLPWLIIDRKKKKIALAGNINIDIEDTQKENNTEVASESTENVIVEPKKSTITTRKKSSTKKTNSTTKPTKTTTKKN